MSRRSIQQLTLCVCLFWWTGVGCSDESDLSQTAKYADALGTRYRTKVDMYGHGLYANDGSRRVQFLWISPVIGSGREIAFNRKIPAGQIFQVVGIRKQFVLAETGIQFVLVTQGLDVPPDLEIRLPLYGRWKDVNGYPDPNFFERLEAAQ